MQAYCNVIEEWGKEATSQCTINQWFAEFCFVERSLKDEKGQRQHSFLDNDMLKETDATQIT